MVKLHHYPRVCGSEVLCLLSWSGWARFLRPVGTDHRVCALTDGEQHTDTDNPLFTPARTAQPLSAEADPFVQGETLGDGSKGRRNDLEWRSRELAKQEVDFKEAQRNRFSFLKQIPKQLLCVLSKFFFFPRQIEFFTNLFEPFALSVQSKNQNLIGFKAD